LMDTAKKTEWNPQASGPVGISLITIQNELLKSLQCLERAGVYDVDAAYAITETVRGAVHVTRALTQATVMHDATITANGDEFDALRDEIFELQKKIAQLQANNTTLIALMERVLERYEPDDEDIEEQEREA